MTVQGKVAAFIGLTIGLAVIIQPSQITSLFRGQLRLNSKLLGKEESKMFWGSSSEKVNASAGLFIIPEHDNMETVVDDGGGVTDYTTGIHTCTVGNESVKIPITAPSFIIIGAQKSGTTALFHYLIKHPNVIPPKKWVTKRHFEIHFFDSQFPQALKDRFDTDGEFYCFARKKYVEQFLIDSLTRTTTRNNSSTNNSSTVVVSAAPLLMTFEKTPIYLLLRDPNLPETIRKTCPWLKKIVAILRNPVERAFSHYRMALSMSKNEQLGSFESLVELELEEMRKVGLAPPKKSNGREQARNFTLLSAEQQEEAYNSLKSKIVILRRGMYAIQLRQWIRVFPYPDSLLVLNYDDLSAGEDGAHEVYNKMLRHVGLPDYDLPGGYPKIFVGRRWQVMSNETRRLLEEFYAPYNAQLGELLGEEWRGVWNSNGWVS